MGVSWKRLEGLPGFDVSFASSESEREGTLDGRTC